MLHVVEQPSDGKALVRVLVQHFFEQDHVMELHIEGVVYFVLEDLLHEGLVLLRGEGVRAREHFEEHDPQSPDVGLEA